MPTPENLYKIDEIIESLEHEEKLPLRTILLSMCFIMKTLDEDVAELYNLLFEGEET